jgi:archaellum component FlaC
MLKKIKKLFIVEEESLEEKLDKVVKENSAPTTRKSKPKAAKTSSEQAIVETEIFDSNIQGPAKPAKKFTSILLKALNKNNLDGSDYLEFKDSLHSLKNVIDDEATRYKSSYAVLSNNGVTKEKLIETSQHYIGVLKEEKTNFESTFRNQQAKQVKAREDKIVKLTQGLEKRKVQLQKLITEIESMEEQLKGAKKEVNQVAGKVQLTKDQFMASYHMIIDQINTDVSKIKKYITK